MIEEKELDIDGRVCFLSQKFDKTAYAQIQFINHGPHGYYPDSEEEADVDKEKAKEIIAFLKDVYDL